MMLSELQKLAVDELNRTALYKQDKVLYDAMYQFLTSPCMAAWDEYQKRLRPEITKSLINFTSNRPVFYIQKYTQHIVDLRVQIQYLNNCLLVPPYYK